jgi:hypothetical protein
MSPRTELSTREASDPPDEREPFGDRVIRFASRTPTDAVEGVSTAMIKHGVRSCPLYLYLTCFISNSVVRGSLRCASSSRFGPAPLSFPKRMTRRVPDFRKPIGKTARRKIGSRAGREADHDFRRPVRITGLRRSRLSEPAVLGNAALALCRGRRSDSSELRCPSVYDLRGQRLIRRHRRIRCDVQSCRACRAQR